MIKAFFATDIQGGLGLNGSLPWPHDKEDLKRFKQYTSGHVVVMGSNTWNDPALPKPLPNRKCIVVSNQSADLYPLAHDVVTGDNLQCKLSEIEKQNADKTVWVIGGAKILYSCQDYIQQIELTTFMTDYHCDVSLDMAAYLKNFNRVEESFGRNKIFTKWIRR